MTIRTLVLLIAAAALGALVGCTSSPATIANGDDPLAALRSSAPSTRYNSGYWKEQGRAASAGANAPARDRWTEALAYCGDQQPRRGLEADGAKPNCNAVRSASYDLRDEEAGRVRNAQIKARADRERNMTPAQRDSAFKAQMFKP